MRAPANRRELRQASIHVVEGQSLVIPVVIDGLPEELHALGRAWARKREFHLTALAARVLEALPDAPAEMWELVAPVASNRWVGPIELLDDVRHVTHPERPGLQTLIVMARCPGLGPLYDDLNRALAAQLHPPPAHITLYSTDPGQGIGIVDEGELRERAVLLNAADQESILRARGLS